MNDEFSFTSTVVAFAAALAAAAAAAGEEEEEEEGGAEEDEDMAEEGCRGTGGIKRARTPRPPTPPRSRRLARIHRRKIPSRRAVFQEEVASRKKEKSTFSGIDGCLRSSEKLNKFAASCEGKVARKRSCGPRLGTRSEFAQDFSMFLMYTAIVSRPPESCMPRYAKICTFGLGPGSYQGVHLSSDSLVIFACLRALKDRAAVQSS